MRALILLIANVVVIGTVVLQDPQYYMQGVQNSAKSISTRARNYFYEKKVNFEGTVRLSPKDLVATLPVDKSVIWWLANQETVEKKLLENSMIDQVDVSHCGYTSWGCFNIKITERKPEYVALLGNKPWLIGRDGGFIAPLDSFNSASIASMKMTTEDLNDAVFINGLLEKPYSPDVLEVKINFLSQAISLIQKKMKLKVREIEVNSDSEISVKFKNYEFPSKFTFSDASLSKIEDQTLRLKKIILEYGERASEIREVDLAFDHIAVVKKNEEKEVKEVKKP